MDSHTSAIQSPGDHSNGEADLPSDILSIVPYYEGYNSKLYMSGFLNKKNETTPEGKSYSMKSWTRWYVELRGPTLVFWKAEKTHTIQDIEGICSQTSPNFLNISDSVVEVIGTLKKKKDNVFSLNTSGANRFYIQAESEKDVNDWVCAIYLSCYEFSKLHEMFTYVLLTRPEHADMFYIYHTSMEGDIEIKYPGSAQWKKYWAILDNSPGTTPDFAQILLYENKKSQPAIIISKVTQAYAVYPNSPHEVEQLTTFKVEGLMHFMQPSKNQKDCGFLLVKTATQKELAEWLISSFDAYRLLGRPEQLFIPPAPSDDQALFLQLEDVHHISIKNASLAYAKVQFNDAFYYQLQREYQIEEQLTDQLDDMYIEDGSVESSDRARSLESQSLPETDSISHSDEPNFEGEQQVPSNEMTEVQSESEVVLKEELGIKPRNTDKYRKKSHGILPSDSEEDEEEIVDSNSESEDGNNSIATEANQLGSAPEGKPKAQDEVVAPPRPTLSIPEDDANSVHSDSQNPSPVPHSPRIASSNNSDSVSVVSSEHRESRGISPSGYAPYPPRIRYSASTSSSSLSEEALHKAGYRSRSHSQSDMHRGVESSHQFSGTIPEDDDSYPYEEEQMNYSSPQLSVDRRREQIERQRMMAVNSQEYGFDGDSYHEERPIYPPRPPGLLAQYEAAKQAQKDQPRYGPLIQGIPNKKKHINSAAAGLVGAIAARQQFKAAPRYTNANSGSAQAELERQRGRAIEREKERMMHEQRQQILYRDEMARRQYRHSSAYRDLRSQSAYGASMGGHNYDSRLSMHQMPQSKRMSSMAKPPQMNRPTSLYPRLHVENENQSLGKSLNRHSMYPTHSRSQAPPSNRHTHYGALNPHAKPIPAGYPSGIPSQRNMRMSMPPQMMPDTMPLQSPQHPPLHARQSYADPQVSGAYANSSFHPQQIRAASSSVGNLRLSMPPGSNGHMYSPMANVSNSTSPRASRSVVDLPSPNPNTNPNYNMAHARSSNYLSPPTIPDGESEFSGETPNESQSSGQEQSFNEFVDDCIEVKPYSYVSSAVLYDAYLQWCRSHKVKNPSIASPAEVENLMVDSGFVKKRRRASKHGAAGGNEEEWYNIILV
ncbi:hypothetical protein K493DRAFT_1969 [Basidiobolus meristosporus CBS 931.73]|uniref:PH domain-containing protein n=1 Tax=Basidiobolus meristosporus CBS 931.73 TaxID=1314790 RepID=A0A1Y1YME6_9FUNG|nr:hypothetical protein K493DRAFT_1969 [Basidiobolus meristosporus CBS 931.73]|eukprot:ORX99189.1 hypothetical protein K493DRAFT_1969 [Basidiobolus meristosporus CBS 931.73]